MKKLLALILCIVLSVFAFASCNGNDTDGTGGVETLVGKTPEQLYEFSQEKLADATSYSVKATMDFVVRSTDPTQTETFTMAISSESKINGEDVYMNVYNDIEPSANMEVWYVDGVIYANSGGVKGKATVDMDAFKQQYMNIEPSESTLLDIPQSWFEDIKFEKDGDSWVLNFVVSGEKYTQVYENIGLPGATIMGDVSYKMYFDNDGNIQKLVASLDMSIGETATAHAESVSIITIGEVEITAPADADSYIETNIQ